MTNRPCTYVGMRALRVVVCPTLRHALTAGPQNYDIGGRLGIRTKTVDNHRNYLMRKIIAFSVAELMSFAMREGLLDTDWET